MPEEENNAETEEAGDANAQPERVNVLADRFLQRYPVDELFSPATLRLLTIPVGYKGIRVRFGDRPSLWGMDVGGEVKPGIRFMLGLGGLWSSMAVVDTTRRTNDLEMQEVITEGGLTLPRVDASAIWQVTDPVKAMTEATRTKDPRTGRIGYEHQTIETALGRVRGYLQGRTLEELGKESVREKNLAYLTDEEAKSIILERNEDERQDLRLYDLLQRGDEERLERYGFEFEDGEGQLKVFFRPPELRDIGTRINSLYITSMSLPRDIEMAMAQQEVAASQARGQLEIARLAEQTATGYAKAAQIYSSNPGAMDLLYLELAREVGKSSNNTIIPIEGGVEGIKRLIRGMSGTN